MSYYGQGDYYRGDYYRGSIFSAIGNVVKGVAGAVSRAGIPIVSGIAGEVNTLLTHSNPSVGNNAATAPSFSMSAGGSVPVISASTTASGGPRHPIRQAAHALMPHLVAGVKHRRMNAGNAKAARRAIRRIKAVRHLLHGIERELPHRKCTHSHASFPFRRKKR